MLECYDYKIFMKIKLFPNWKTILTSPDGYPDTIKKGILSFQQCHMNELFHIN